MKGQIDPLALKAISDLQRPDEPNLLERVAEVFLSESPKAIRNIRKALEIRDMQQVCFAASTLKSNSAYLGVAGLSDRCRKLENAALEENFAACAITRR